MTLQPRTKPRRLPLLPLLARWMWLLPSLLVLAAWGRSFQVIDAVQFGSWALVTRVPATVELVWPEGNGLVDRAHWHTTIREGRVDYFYLPLLRAEKTYRGTYFTPANKVYETTIQIPFWALLLPALPLIPLPWWRSRKVIQTANRDAAGLCPHCGYDLRATPGRCPECGMEQST